MQPCPESVERVTHVRSARQTTAMFKRRRRDDDRRSRKTTRNTGRGNRREQTGTTVRAGEERDRVCIKRERGEKGMI